MSPKTSKYTITQSELEEDRAQRATARASGSDENNNPVWKMDDNLRVAVQFLADPLDEDNSVRYREIQVNRLRNVHGLWSDASPWPGVPRDLVNYYMSPVPVIDFVREAKGKIKYTNTDMVKINGKDYNLIKDIADPGDRDFDITDEGDCMSSWRTVVDVVVHYWEDSQTKKGRDRKHPQTGDHVLLKFRDSDWKGIQAALKVRQDEEGEDLLGSVWVLRLTPGKMGGVRRQQAIAKYPQPILNVEEVDPFDIEEQLDLVKQNFLNHVAAAETDMYVEGGGEDITAGIVGKDETVDTGPDPLDGVDFDMLPVVRLREIAEQAGLTVPPRASRVTLLKMCNGIKAMAGAAQEPPPF